MAKWTEDSLARGLGEDTDRPEGDREGTDRGGSWASQGRGRRMLAGLWEGVWGPWGVKLKGRVVASDQLQAGHGVGGGLKAGDLRLECQPFSGAGAMGTHGSSHLGLSGFLNL